MLFRVNYKNFLLHMIDYFTREELLNFQYLAVSAAIAVRSGWKEKVAKSNYLYPSSELIINYMEGGDLNLLRKSYRHELESTKNDIYLDIIQPILKYRHNYLLVCHEDEDVYLDILVEYLSKNYAMKCIDLNDLFTKGETEIFLLDRKKVHNSVVKLSRNALKQEYDSLASTVDGRAKLIGKMGKKEKIRKLKELGVKVRDSDRKNLDDLLAESWVDGGEAD